MIIWYRVQSFLSPSNSVNFRFLSSCDTIYEDQGISLKYVLPNLMTHMETRLSSSNF